MSKLDRLLGGEVSRRDFLRMTTIALGTCAAAFALKACEGIQVSPDYIEFFKKTKDLLKTDNIDQSPVPIKVDIMADDDFFLRESFYYWADSLKKDDPANKNLILDKIHPKSFSLTTDEIIAVPDTPGWVYIFNISGKEKASENQLSESHISSIYVFDASAGKDYDPFKAKDTSIGRGVVFNWKQNANKNQINIEQQVYIDVESSYWPLHIDISTIGTEIPDFIEIGPSTVWHPITMDQNKKSVLLSLVEDWKNLLKEDRQGDGSRLVLIQKFITKNANIIKDNIR